MKGEWWAAFRVFGDKLYPRDRCETHRSRIEQDLRTFPYRSLKSESFQSSPEFSYIFYVKHWIQM